MLAVPNLAYKSVTPAYVNLAPGAHTVRLTPAGSNTTTLQQTVTVWGGAETTIAAVKTTSGVALQALTDGNLAPPSGQSRVRIGHFTPGAPPVDIYANGQRVLTALDYRSTRLLTIPNGTYAISVTATGATTPILSLPAVPLNGANVSVFAVAGASAGALDTVLVPALARTHFPSHTAALPVALNVAGTSDLGLGNALRFGGLPAGNTPYDIGRVFGLTDWRGNGHEPQGDWRTFYVDVPDANAPITGTAFLVNTTWSNTPTDIDVHVWGPRERDVLPDGRPFINYGVGCCIVNPAVSGPYDLARKARSVSTYHDADGNPGTGGESFSFQTTSGGASEWLTGPLSKGLHIFSMQNVLYGGASPAGVPFTTSVGSAVVSPTRVEATTSQLTSTFQVTLTASLDLPGVEARAYGLSTPTVISDAVGQANPPENLSDPNGNKFYPLTVNNSGLLDITTTPNGDVPNYDIDLYLERKVGTTWSIVAQSTGGTAEEEIRLTLPPNGEYRVHVSGYNVPPGAGYTLTIKNAQGADLTVSNLPTSNIPAGTPVRLTVTYNAGFSGTREGVVFVGPTGAPTAFTIPVTVTSTRTFLFLPHISRGLAVPTPRP